MRSPVIVLTGPDVALLHGSDENRSFQRGMVVGDFNVSLEHFTSSFTLKLFISVTCEGGILNSSRVSAVLTKRLCERAQ